MKKLVILLLISPLLVFSQQEKKEKKQRIWPNFFIGGNLGVVSGIGSYRDWGILEGGGANLEMGRYLFSQFALIGKIGFYEFIIDQNKFDMACRNVSHLSDEFNPVHLEATPYFETDYLMGGF